MTIWYKQGVYGDLNNKPQKALSKVHSLYSASGEDLFITSIREGNHSAGSLHYIGDAFDIRYPYKIPVSQASTKIKERLGKDFDVVAESDHIHIEFDPK